MSMDDFTHGDPLHSTDSGASAIDRDRTPPQRLHYRAPVLLRLGSAVALTRAVSMRGLRDGFMMRRTG